VYFSTTLSATDTHRTGMIQVNCRNSSETISGLQIRLNHGLPCLGAMLEAYHKLHP